MSLDTCNREQYTSHELSFLYLLHTIIRSIDIYIHTYSTHSTSQIPMRRHRPIVNCKCQHCGFEWSFEAKSKADAARMTGPATCGKDDCREKTSKQIDELVKELLKR